MARKKLSTKKQTNLKSEVIDKETPEGLPVDPKTGLEIPAPREVLGEGGPDFDEGPSMVGTTIIPGGTR